MVQLKYRAFASNKYAYIQLFQLGAIAIFSALFTYFLIDDIVFSLVLLIIVPTFFFLFFYLSNPLAYKRVCVNSEGIRCGKTFVKYSDVINVTIVDGYVEEWQGFRFLEKTFGITQSIDYYIGDIICVNCEFNGFKPKNPEKYIYIPKNKKSEEILERYCEKYIIASKDKSQTIKKRPKFSKYFIPTCIKSAVVCPVFCVILFAMFPDNLWKGFWLSLFTTLWVILPLCKR